MAGYEFGSKYLLEGYHHSRRLQLMLYFLSKLGHNLLVLDAGCGEGVQAKRISEKNKVVGVDVSRMRIQRARRNVPEGSFIIGDLNCLPFRGRIFDVSVLGEVLEHLRKPNAVLKQISRVLAHDGHLILDIPSKSNIIDMFLRALGRKPIWGLRIDMEHVTFYDEVSMRRLLRSACFQVLDIRGGPCIRYDFPFVPFLGSLTWNRRGWWFFKITDKIFGSIPVIRRKGAIQVYMCEKLE